MSTSFSLRHEQAPTELKASGAPLISGLPGTHGFSPHGERAPSAKSVVATVGSSSSSEGNRF